MGAQVGRAFLRGTVTALGVSGVAAALLGGVSGALLYQWARPHGKWGTDEPPEGLAEDVIFPSHEDGMRIRGWFLPADGPGPAPTVVFCHGVFTGRREGLPLALRLRSLGFSSLTFDFRAHGASDGRFTSVGHHETHDVMGAVRYLLGRPDVDHDRIGMVGFSMGAAAAIRATAAMPEVSALVADSSYSSFRDAVHYSFRHVVHFPEYPFAPIALLWARWMMHVDVTDLRPLDVIGRIAPRPIFIIHGASDTIIPERHARLLFKAAGEPKELWIAPNAHHVGARDIYPDEYVQRVQDFFLATIGRSAPAPRAGIVGAYRVESAA